MNIFADNLLDPGANFCPDCGEPRVMCTCDEADVMAGMEDDWNQDEPRERVECKYCHGDGMLDDISPCPHCDGEGFEWWLA